MAVDRIDALAAGLAGVYFGPWQLVYWGCRWWVHCRRIVRTGVYPTVAAPRWRWWAIGPLELRRYLPDR